MKTKGFVGVLENLSRLTALEIIHTVVSELPLVLYCIFAMSKLRTLTLKPRRLHLDQICAPTRTSRMQLTKLSWQFDASLLKLMNLTRIAHFDIELGKQTCHEDLVRALDSMPDLQFLCIYSEAKGQLVPSHVLGRMTKLKVLEVGGVYTDEAIYQSLATLPELTDLSLDFHSRKFLIPTFMYLHTQINLLTNLRSLRFMKTYPIKPYALLESLSGEHLKRLQTLYVSSANLNDDRRAVLFRRFQSLRCLSDGRASGFVL